MIGFHFTKRTSRSKSILNLQLLTRFILGSVISIILTNCSSSSNYGTALNGDIFVSSFMDENDSIYLHAELNQEWIGNYFIRFDFLNTSTGTEITFKDAMQIPSELSDTVRPSISIPLHIHASNYGNHPFTFKLNGTSNPGTLKIDSAQVHLHMNEGENVLSDNQQ